MVGDGRDSRWELLDEDEIVTLMAVDELESFESEEETVELPSEKVSHSDAYCTFCLGIDRSTKAEDTNVSQFYKFWNKFANLRLDSDNQKLRFSNN